MCVCVCVLAYSLPPTILVDSEFEHHIPTIAHTYSKSVCGSPCFQRSYGLDNPLVCPPGITRVISHLQTWGRKHKMLVKVWRVYTILGALERCWKWVVSNLWQSQPVEITLKHWNQPLAFPEVDHLWVLHSGPLPLPKEAAQSVLFFSKSPKGLCQKKDFTILPGSDHQCMVGKQNFSPMPRTKPTKLADCLYLPIKKFSDDLGIYPHLLAGGSSPAARRFRLKVPERTSLDYPWHSQDCCCGLLPIFIQIHIGFSINRGTPKWLVYRGTCH